MPPLLAQLPDPTAFSSIGWVVLSLAALAVAWNQIDEARRRSAGTGDRCDIKPTPLPVDMVTAPATRVDLDKLREDTRRDIADLYNKLGDSVKATSALDTLSEVQRQQIAAIEADIKKLIAEKEDRK